MRSWLYQLLKNDATLQGLVPGGWFAAEGFSSSDLPADSPFGVYRMGNLTSEGIATAYRQFIIVHVHDYTASVGGDYLKIDAALDRVEDLLENAPPSPADHFIQAIFLERSQDFDDQDFATLFRYSRFQLVGSR